MPTNFSSHLYFYHQRSQQRHINIKSYRVLVFSFSICKMLTTLLSSSGLEVSPQNYRKAVEYYFSSPCYSLPLLFPRALIRRVYNSPLTITWSTRTPTEVIHIIEGMGGIHNDSSRIQTCTREGLEEEMGTELKGDTTQLEQCGTHLRGLPVPCRNQ